MTDIELSGSGIKFSYIRFLSDSAAGFIVILIVIGSYYHPICGMSLHQVLPDQSIPISSNVGTFVLVLLFLLTTPLGLLINIASWILLGPIVLYLTKYWFDCDNYILGYIVKSTKDLLCFEMLKESFNLCDNEDKKCFFDVVNRIDIALGIYCPKLAESLDYVKGVQKLSRSIAFISLLFIPCCAYDIIFGNIILFIISVIFIIISSIARFYYYLSILSKAKILCLECTIDQKGAKEDGVKEIIKCLSTSCPKLYDVSERSASASEKPNPKETTTED